MTKTIQRISISRNASTAVHAQRSVLTPRLPTANVPAKMPAKSRLFPWEKTLLRISIIQSASPAVHAFISVRSARSWVNHLSLTRLTSSKRAKKIPTIRRLRLLHPVFRASLPMQNSDRLSQGSKNSVSIPLLRLLSERIWLQ